MPNATTQMYLLGTLWTVEIEYEYFCHENCEQLDLVEVWLLGYYPEGTGKNNDYVPCHIKADINCMTTAEYEQCRNACREHMAETAREAFDDNHGYED